jgi:hypothetical protein
MYLENNRKITGKFFAAVVPQPLPLITEKAGEGEKDKKAKSEGRKGKGQKGGHKSNWETGRG